MAFVFRSEKKSIFQDKILNNEIQLQPPLPNLAQNENKPQDKSIDLTRVIKGFPSSDQKYKRNVDEKQQFKGIPQFQVKPIHKSQSYVTLKQILYSSKTQGKLDREQKQNYKSINKVFQAKKSNKSHKSSLMLSLTKKNIKSNQFQEKLKQSQPKIQKQKQQIQHTRSQPNIVNKNLLKTLSKLRSKQNIPQSFKQINMINQKHFKSSLDPHSQKKINFQSFKKLSPIKFVSKENLQQNAITLFLNNKTLSKIETQEQQNQSKSQTKKILKPIQLKQELVQEQEQQQFDQGATPGPGAYNFENWNKKKQFRSKRQKFGKIFYSSLQRFQIPSKLNQVTLVKEQIADYVAESPSKNTFTSFLSKSPRFKKQKQTQIPPPGYYNTRQTLQYDLIKNILKGSNSDTFINSEYRHSIIPKKKQPQPGPGSYYADSFVDKTLQEHGVLTSTYKSKLTRNLHPQTKDIAKKEEYYDSILQMEGDAKFNPIHVQDASTLPADYQIEVPPFLSSSQRFPILKPICKESFCKKKTQIQVKKQVKKQAFNSSQKRKFQNTMGSGVGVGLYNISAKQTWNKKSHNILFN